MDNKPNTKLLESEDEKGFSSSNLSGLYNELSSTILRNSKHGDWAAPFRYRDYERSTWSHAPRENHSYYNRRHGYHDQKQAEVHHRPDVDDASIQDDKPKVEDSKRSSRWSTFLRSSSECKLHNRNKRSSIYEVSPDTRHRDREMSKNQSYSYIDPESKLQCTEL